MNVERIFFWLRLVFRAVLDILDAVDDEPGTGPQSVTRGPSGFKPERIQVWLRILAQAGLEAIDDVAEPGNGPEGVAIRPEFKPERIQFWLRLIVRFVFEIFEGIGEETGKSGEQGAEASDPQGDGW